MEAKRKNKKGENERRKEEATKKNKRRGIKEG